MDSGNSSRSHLMILFIVLVMLVGVGFYGMRNRPIHSSPPTEKAPASVQPIGDKPGDPPTPDQQIVHSEVVDVEPAQFPESPPALSEAEAKDVELRKQFVGFWFHSESGEHWIENRSDGTSRMMLKLDFVASLLYGKETAMELAWEVKDGILTHTIVSGSPQANVDSLVKAFGKTRGYTILETTPERMLLESKDEKKKQDLWTRMAPPQEWAEKQPETPGLK